MPIELTFTFVELLLSFVLAFNACIHESQSVVEVTIALGFLKFYCALTLFNFGFPIIVDGKFFV